tara:strand:+ start:929 stop:1390 length:462 start_codon:yes stop_codon:yes gene_type:complete
MTDDHAMENMLSQIEVASFEKRADEIIKQVNETREIPNGMKLEIDNTSGEIDHEGGIFYCKAQIPSPQQIEEEKVSTAKKIQAIAVKADNTWARKKELHKKIKDLTTTKFMTPIQPPEGMKKLIEWSKREQIREELIMEKLYPLREWAKRMNP